MGAIFRKILIGLDWVVYEILEQIFQLIINLANFDLFSEGVLTNFSQRIYLILGLVMVFKLIISFVQILIDPDKIDDKEQGVMNILKRVVISMILIVLVPGIFGVAKSVQTQLVVIIPKVVLGVPADVDINESEEQQENNNVDNDTKSLIEQEKEDKNIMASTGKLMAYYSFLPFFYYNKGCEGIGTLKGTGSKDSVPEIDSVASAVSHVNDKKYGCSETDDGYDYNYRYLVSTACGVYLIYVLITVALKIAIRSIKFGICELVAPIPIASYIDPKSSKKAFDNWVSTSVKVYLDLFTRLIVVYFVVFIFKILFDGEKFRDTLSRYGDFQGLLVILFIIIGLLYFAKEMPKFISGMLGVSDSFGDMADMFKGQGWKALGGLGATMVAAHRGALENWRSAKAASAVTGEGKGTFLRRALGGYVGTMRRGLSAVSQGQKVRDVYNSYESAHQLSKSRVNKKAVRKAQNKAHDDAITSATSNYNSDIETAENVRTQGLSKFKRFFGRSRGESMEMMYNEEVAEAKNKLEKLKKANPGVETSYNNAVKEAAAAKRTTDDLYNRIQEAEAKGDKRSADALTRQWYAASQSQKELEIRRDSLKSKVDEIAKAQSDYDKLNYTNMRNNDKKAISAKEKLDLSRAKIKTENERMKTEMTNLTDQEAVAINRVRNATERLEQARASGDKSAIQKYTDELQIAQNLQLELRSKKQILEQEHTRQRQELDLEVQRNIDEYNRVINRSQAEVIADNYSQQYNDMQTEISSIEKTYQDAISNAQKTRDKAIDAAPSRVTPIKTSLSDTLLGRETLTAAHLNELVSNTNSIKGEALGQATKKAVEYADQLYVTIGKDNKGNSIRVKFDQLLDAKKQADLGKTEFTFKDDNGKALEINGSTSYSLSGFDAKFTTFEKNAQVEYITEQQAGHLFKKDEFGNPTTAKLDDPLIDKTVTRFNNLLDVIEERDPKAAAQLRDIFNGNTAQGRAPNPGKAIKTASDIAENWAVEADRLNILEQATQAVKQAEKK